MKNFSLKNRLIWLVATILACGSGIVISTPLEAVIPTGQLNEDEFKVVAGYIQEIKAYTENIKVATNALFTQKNPFREDLARLTALRNDITTIHAKIPRSGSLFAQEILKQLKGLTQYLRDAQKEWVIILTTQSLLKMKEKERDMANKYQETQRFILGAKNRNNQHDGEGLIGHLTKAGHAELKTEITLIQTNITFIFNYQTTTKISKYSLAMHLIDNKGFSPRLIKMLPKAFFG